MDFMRASSGLPGLDRMLDDLRVGDNVVWQVDNIDDYRYFTGFFIQETISQKKRLVYLRFVQHPAIVPPILELTDNNLYHEYV